MEVIKFTIQFMYMVHFMLMKEKTETVFDWTRTSINIEY